MKNKYAILMIDLSGYTALTQVHGALSAFKTIKSFEKIANSSLIGQSKIMERVGDELLIISPDVLDIALTALKIQEQSRDKSEFLLTHSGIHYGEVIIMGHSLFGSAINITSRISGLAKENEILCSMEFIQMLPNSKKFTTRELGRFQFRNLFTDTTVYSLSKPMPKKVLKDSIIDPVCKMIIGIQDIKLKKVYGEDTYHFCSTDCMHLFDKGAERFIGQH